MTELLIIAALMLFLALAGLGLIAAVLIAVGALAAVADRVRQQIREQIGEDEL